MPRVEDLVEVGLSPLQAKHLGAVTNGVEGTFTALSATGNNSQADAYQITGNYNQFTTVTATLNSAKLPLAINSPLGQIVVRNADSTDSLYLFPGVGDNLNNLAANAAITVSADSAVSCFRVSDTAWICDNIVGSSIPDGSITTAKLADNAVTNAKLRDSAALSVIGRSANSLGDPADITAALDGNVLRRSGTTLGFGAIALASSNAVSGVLDETNGGTGQSTIAQGDLLYGSAADTFAKLPKDTNSTRVLTNTGTANGPAWGQVNLTNGVTGVLPFANGGTPIVNVLALASDVTSTGTAYVDVTGMSFSYTANTVYVLDYYLLVSSAAATTGHGFGWNTSTTITNLASTFFHQLATTGTLSGGSGIGDDNATQAGVSSGVPGTGTQYVSGSALLITNANAGTAQFRKRSEVAANSTILAGSVIIVRKVITF